MIRLICALETGTSVENKLVDRNSIKNDDDHHHHDDGGNDDRHHDLNIWSLSITQCPMPLTKPEGRKEFGATSVSGKSKKLLSKKGLLGRICSRPWNSDSTNLNQGF